MRRIAFLFSLYYCYVLIDVKLKINETVSILNIFIKNWWSVLRYLYFKINVISKQIFTINKLGLILRRRANSAKLLAHLTHTRKKYTSVSFKINFFIYRVSQEECARIRESVPYVKVYRYNPKHLYPKLNSYGDNGQRSLKLWQLLHTYWLPNTY